MNGICVLTSRLAVQIPQFGVLGLDLGGVDFGGGGDDVGPPVCLGHFVEMDGDFFARGDGFEGPGGFVDVNFVGEVALGEVLEHTAECCF